MDPQYVSSLEYCYNLVRRHDYQNYLTSLLLPKHLVIPSLSLLAINIEIAIILSQSKGRQGFVEMQIRIWEDAVQSLSKNEIIARNPTILLLSHLSKSHSIPFDLIALSIRNRLKMTQVVPFQDITEMEDYFNDNFPLFYKILSSIDGPENIDQFSSLFDSAGTFICYSNFLKSFICNHQAQRIIIPPALMKEVIFSSLLDQFQIDYQEFVKGIWNENSLKLFDFLYDRSFSHFSKFDQLLSSYPKSKSLFLYNVPAEYFLKRFKSNKYEITKTVPYINSIHFIPSLLLRTLKLKLK